MTKRTLIFHLFVLLSFFSRAQRMISIDASKVSAEIKAGHLKMGNAGPSGQEIKVNSKYLSIGGKPVLPVMCEIHYSRIPEELWEEVLLKMKAAGINVIASYVFWNHHEEIEGVFNWAGNKALRDFAKLCLKHNLFFYPRIGPWCHGEVRNGGTPDWILLKDNLSDRSNDPLYQYYVDRLYQEIGKQLEGLFYKDKGPIIGIQLENEYSRGIKGEEHIIWLKQTAIKYGMDVPLYTVTGWGNASVPEGEVIPLWGGYPDEPWANHVQKTINCDNYKFALFRDDDKIGNDLVKKKSGERNQETYPYFTCEMGLGIENTDHRRLTIGPLDGYGLVNAKLGSGSNLIGYYVFAGGSNPKGELTSMEENKGETGYWNTNPQISYNFQAAIQESGQLSASYFKVKKLHYFLNEFGGTLAPMEPVFAKNLSGFQYSVRADEKSAFLFGSNYCRNNRSLTEKGVQFKVKLKKETITFPSRPIDIPDSSFFLWPINFSLDNKVKLKYATAQPLCKIYQNGAPVWVFVQDITIAPEFCFDDSEIGQISSTSGEVQHKNGRYTVSNLRPSSHCIISLNEKSNFSQKILILSKDEADEVWLLGDNNNTKSFYLTQAGLFTNGSTLTIFATNNNVKVRSIAENSNVSQFNDSTLIAKNDGLFSEYSFDWEKMALQVEAQPISILQNSLKLKTSISDTDKASALNHRFFQKQFNLQNSSEIKSAKLYIYSESQFKVQMNNKWVAQEIVSEQLNEIDLFGYVKKGENKLILDFPSTTGEKSFSARISVEYFNTDRINFFSDLSWLYKDSYTFPSYLVRNNGLFKSPEISPKKTVDLYSSKLSEFIIHLPEVPANIENTYLNILYAGDKAKITYRNKLLADNFNNNRGFAVGLNRLPDYNKKKTFYLEIAPIADLNKIYFDLPPEGNEGRSPAVKSIQLIPEYKIVLPLNHQKSKLE